MKKKRYVALLYSLILAFLLFSLSAVLAAKVQAEEDGADVVISIRREKNYRYAVDVLFRNVVLVYRLESIAVNTETGKTYVNSGRWLESGGAVCPSFEVTVANHSDTPIRTATEFFAAEFVRCGADIVAHGNGETVLPPVALPDGQQQICENRASAVFGMYPALDSYAGEKHITATVRIDRADGTATDGSPFRARWQ